MPELATFNGKRLFFAGVSTAAVEAGEILRSRGAQLAFSDHRRLTELPGRLQEGLKRLGQAGATLELGGYKDQSFTKADWILVGRGVPLNATPLLEARRRGIPVSSEIELALRETKSEVILLAPDTTGALALALSDALRASGQGCWVHVDEDRSALAAASLSPGAPFAVVSLSASECLLLSSARPRLVLLDPVAAPSQEESYRHLLGLAGPQSQVVLSLESPLHALLSSQIQGQALWTSSQPPEVVAGPLAEEFRGAYFEPDTGFIRAALGAKREAFPLAMQGGDLGRWVSLVLAARALGLSRRATQEMLASLSQPLGESSWDASSAEHEV